MANREHVAVVRQGAEAIEKWRKKHPRMRLDMAGADLSGADLSNLNLVGANLSQASLRGARLWLSNLARSKLSGADLSAANLQGTNLALTWLDNANLQGANLARADLINTNLITSDLTSANLRLARLHGALIRGTNFLDVTLNETSFSVCDFSRCIELETVIHEGPSSIGIDTLTWTFRRAGNKWTPALETFFLGGGVPRELLEALPRILAEVKYCTSFISYGSADAAFAKQLHSELTRRGVSCWQYELSATPGEPTWREIGQKRREAEKFVVLCSAEALLRAGVLKEIEEQKDEDADKIVPISLDNIWTQKGFRIVRGEVDLKPFLMDRNYADFTNRKDPAAYERELNKLLNALRRPESVEEPNSKTKGTKQVAALSGAEDPLLAELWNNDADAAYDRL